MGGGGREGHLPRRLFPLDLKRPQSKDWSPDQAGPCRPPHPLHLGNEEVLLSEGNCQSMFHLASVSLEYWAGGEGRSHFISVASLWKASVSGTSNSGVLVT